MLSMTYMWRRMSTGHTSNIPSEFLENTEGPLTLGNFDSRKVFLGYSWCASLHAYSIVGSIIEQVPGHCK